METSRVALPDGRFAGVARLGTGPPLLCIAGGPGFAASHLGTLGGVDAGRTLVRVDVRGAGDSDPPQSRSWSVDEYVADVRAVSEALDLGRVDVFGHSHGGFVAAAYAADHPAAVRRVVLDGMPVRPRDLEPPATGLDGFFAKPDAATQAYLGGLALYEDANEWFGGHEWDRIDIEALLPRIEAETLMITGDADWACGATAAGAAAALLPAGQVAVIADAGHFAWVENPAAYAAAVLRFLDG